MTDTVSGLRRYLFLRPTLGILLTLLFVLSGWMAWKSMVKESTPDLAIPIATVETTWGGADPESIEQQLTNPIENEIKSLKGLKKLRSASFNSFSVVVVEFDADADVTDAMTRLRAAVADAEPELPEEADKPRIIQSSVDDTPVLTIALSGDIDPGLMGRTADRLQDVLERVAGVNEVTLSGTRDEIVRIRLILPRLVALGLSASQIRDRIQAANQDMPWDRFEGETIGASLRLYGRFREVADLEQLPIMRMDSGRVVRLGEVAEVRRELDRETERTALSWRGGEFRPSVDISIKKVPGSDTLAVIDRAKAAMADQAGLGDWPLGLEYRITSDQSESINDDLAAVLENGWQAMLGVFLVLFVVLSWREALVAGIAIPVTFLGTLGVLWVLGNSMNQIVIVGLVLALGLMVDVFILMMEGMHENIFGRRKRFDDAALNTVSTYAAPAFAGQMTTILAMAPLLVIGGVAGKFIRVMPLTTIITLIASFLVALLITVPLSRFLLGRIAGGDAKPTLMDRLTRTAGARLEAWSLKVSLRNRLATLPWIGGALVLLVLSVMAAGTLPSEMFPKDDGRNLGVTVELPPDVTLDGAHQCAVTVGEVLRDRDYFESVVRFTGAKSPYAMPGVAGRLTPARDTYLVSFSATFTPLAEREQAAYRYLDELRAAIDPALDACPGGRLSMIAQTGGTSSEAPVQVRIEGENIDTLRTISAEVQRTLRGIDGATDAQDSLGPARLDVKTLPRREALDFHEVQLGDLAYQVRVAMGDDEVGSFSLGGTEDDLDILMSVAWGSRDGRAGGPTLPVEAALLQVITPDGRALPLFSLVDLDINPAPVLVSREFGERGVTVSAFTEGRTAQEILADLKPELDRLRDGWPAGYDYRFGGESEDMGETFGDATALLGVALFLVFGLLVLQFDSFRQPAIILISVPLAMIGVFATFSTFGISLSFPAMVGIIALVGIVVNNAIVMIDTMNGHRANGIARNEAAAKGAGERLRPILATTITTVVGLIPLALSDPFWMPLCLAIISGLLVSAVISLVIVPALYVLMTPERKTA